MFRKRTRLPSAPVGRARSQGAPLGGFVLVILAVALIGAAVWLVASGRIPLPGGTSRSAGESDSAVSDLSGLAVIDSAGGAVNFQVLSGLSGERLPGIRVQIAGAGRQRLLYADDPTGAYLPVAAPLAGDTTVRRLIMPPNPATGINITTAAPPIDTRSLEPLGTLTEAQLREALQRSGDSAVLLYLYNPQRPLALTGSALDAYATPFPNVLVVRPGADLGDSLAMVVVALEKSAYDAWGHINVDRYLAGRVGQAAAIDLAGDLAFPWAYPVFDVFPPEPTLDLGAGDVATFQIHWRSENPDPPPPWSFFISASQEGAAVSPESFSLGPDQPTQEVTITISRAGLPVGQHSLKVFIQPFSDTFGLISQAVEREITFTIAEAIPTPTAGPSITGLEFTPAEPREGGTLSLVATGFTPGEAVRVEFNGPERTFTDVLPVADENGVLRYEIDLELTPAGSYTLSLTGMQSGIGGTRSIEVGEAIADAIVNSAELNLRTEPFSDAPVLEILVRGDELTVVSVNYDDSWIEVVTRTGVQGWVMTRLVILNIDLSTVPWNRSYPAPVTPY